MIYIIKNKKCSININLINPINSLKVKLIFFIYIIFDIINIWHYYEKIFWQHNKCKGINSEIHYFKIINMRLLLIILL